jgi:hypothetical protein
VLSIVKARSLRTVPAAIICAAALGATSMVAATVGIGAKTLRAEAALLANDIGYIMGGTGLSDPSTNPTYIPNVESLYLQQFLTPPGSPDDYQFSPLITPEQFCPIICTAGQPDLTFGQSVDQGVANLDGIIRPELAGGDNVAVLGYSQSATVATVEMNNLINNPPPGDLYNPSDLHVVLLGDPNSQLGGVLDRFQFPDGIQAFSLESAPQHLPFLDVPLSLAPTPTSPFPTDIYTIEYDGWGNFPEDPSNLLADINALVGIQSFHPDYPNPDFVDSTSTLTLGTIGQTSFHEILAPLPIIAFLQDGGAPGQFLYDLLDPELALNIDWAYGNPGDPGAGIPVDHVDPIGVAGPWQVDATGQLVPSGVAGFVPKMDPLQMLAGEENAAAHTLIDPINALLGDAGQSSLPDSFVNTLLSGYDLTNQLDASLLSSWIDLTASIPALSPDAIFDGAPLISGQPLIDLVGLGFDVFNFFGA